MTLVYYVVINLNTNYDTNISYNYYKKIRWDRGEVAFLSNGKPFTLVIGQGFVMTTNMSLIEINPYYLVYYDAKDKIYFYVKDNIIKGIQCRYGNIATTPICWRNMSSSYNYVSKYEPMTFQYFVVPTIIDNAPEEGEYFMVNLSKYSILMYKPRFNGGKIITLGVYETRITSRIALIAKLKNMIYL
jgi:hypothetical protein